MKTRKIRRLLDQAAIIKGSRLALDAHTADLFLTRHLNKERCALIISRVTRGMFGRNLAKQRGQLLRDAFKERINFERMIAQGAVSVVKEALTVCALPPSLCLCLLVPACLCLLACVSLSLSLSLLAAVCRSVRL